MTFKQAGRPRKLTAGRLRPHSLTDQVAAELRAQIDAGVQLPGTRMPSVRQHAQERGVSNDTVLRAYDQLVTLGYLEARRGSGFYVSQPAPSQTLPLGPEWADGSDTNISWDRLLHRGDLPQGHGPGDGSLPDAWMDHDILRDALDSLRQIDTTTLTHYADPAGYLPLRQQLQIKLSAQGIDAPAAQIITTAGASDALHLAIWSTLFPGNYVAAEDPMPFIHTQRLLASGVEIVKVPRLADGPDLDALQAVCERHRPRMFLCSSLLQNPTSTNLSLHKAHQILKIAETFEMMVIDDDTYGDLLPADRTANTARLAALDQLDRVIHIGSFSKTLGPGLRTGFIAANPERIVRMLLYKAVSAIHGPLVTDHLTHRLLAQGHYQRHCLGLQARLDSVRGHVRDRLIAMGCQVPSPSAGMYLWTRLSGNQNAQDVAIRLAERGILAAPGQLFSFSSAFSSHMRLNIASAHKGAMDTLAEVLASSAIST